LYPPDSRTRDLDNYLKALLDACTHAGLWDDDQLIDQLFVYRGITVKSGNVRMSISEAGPLIPHEAELQM
jgi:crossover junction endodeoxyribonuclease RusA